MKRSSHRMPVVRALGLTWAPLVDDRIHTATVSVVGVCTTAGGAASLESVVWPKGLKHVVLDAGWPAMAVEEVRWPPTLRALSFGGWCRQTHRRGDMASLLAPTTVRARLQPAHRWSYVAGLSAAAIVCDCIQQTHPRSCLARFSTTAIFRISLNKPVAEVT